MSWWMNIYYKLLEIPLSIMVKSEPIPSDPITELGIDPNKKILYILPYHSRVDLLVIRTWCLKFNLHDPLAEFEIDGERLPSYVFINDSNNFHLVKRPSKNDSSAIFHRYLNLHYTNPDLDVQLLPISVLFGRAPDKEGRKKLKLQPLNGLQKFIAILKSGQDCFVRFSKFVSLRYITEQMGHDTNNAISQKLSRIARIHFSRQRNAAVGPQLPIRSVMLQKLIESPAIKKAIKDEAKSKNISIEKAKKSALSMLNEIGANFNFRALRIADHISTWAWNRLYSGLKVSNVEKIRTLAQDGNVIVYTPCHRSHMDYLLLSYVLYRQGLVPPHIAAGINLNFWPVGPIFRRLGAFYIRRSFKGNKLYTAVFREYLSELFSRGYSVEYFVEGGRSRTGRSLQPKTGTLSMTLQALLHGDAQPIIIVPVYIGYEQVMEVRTYANELRGAKKEKESLWLALKAFKKLKKLGYGYVNFGQPIPLNTFLNKNVPEWRKDVDPYDTHRPAWLSSTVNKLANQLMEDINSAATINASNLSSAILLTAHRNALTKEMFLEQLNFYLTLLKNVPYSDVLVFPVENSEQLLDHAIKISGMQISKDNIGEIISLNRKQAGLMTYYRNNIQHLLVLPALITKIILNLPNIDRNNITSQVLLIYPLLKAELFLRFEQDEVLLTYLNALIDELIKQSFFIEQDNGTLTAADNQLILLRLFASNIDESLERYMISLSLLKDNPNIERADLENKSQLIAERLSLLHGINSPEFFDKSMFSTLVSTLKSIGYLGNDEKANSEQVDVLYQTLNSLISLDIRQTITSINKNNITQST